MTIFLKWSRFSDKGLGRESLPLNLGLCFTFHKKCLCSWCWDGTCNLIIFISMNMYEKSLFTLPTFTCVTSIGNFHNTVRHLTVSRLHVTNCQIMFYKRENYHDSWRSNFESSSTFLYGQTHHSTYSSKFGIRVTQCECFISEDEK